MLISRASNNFGERATILLLVSIEPEIDLYCFRNADDIIAMIFLSDNVFLERDLTFDDIKPRLLGIGKYSVY